MPSNEEIREQNAEAARKTLFESENPMDSLHALTFSPIAFPTAIFDFIRGFLFHIIRMSCVPAELLVRHNFGERHFNLGHYIGGIIWFFIWGAGVISLPIGQQILPYTVSNDVIFGVFGFFFALSMLWQVGLRSVFGKINLECHSYYDGDVLPFLYMLPFAKDSDGNLLDSRVRQIHEPLFMMLVGIIIAYTLNPHTGAWILVSGIGMAIKMFAQVQKDRSQILDRIDADIEARCMAEAMNGTPPKDNKGFYIAGLPQKGAFRDQFKALMNSKNNRSSK